MKVTPIVIESCITPPPGYVEIQRDDELSDPLATDDRAAAMVSPAAWRYYSPVLGLSPTPVPRNAWWRDVDACHDRRTRCVVPSEDAIAAGLVSPEEVADYEGGDDHPHAPTNNRAIDERIARSSARCYHHGLTHHSDASDDAPHLVRQYLGEVKHGDVVDAFVVITNTHTGCSVLYERVGS